MRAFVIRTAAFAVFALVVSEVFFRVALPAAELPAGQFNAEYGFRRYDPAWKSEGLFTSGRHAQIRATWKINPQGWNSHRPYLNEKERGKPAVAYFGSSFIEGFRANISANISPVMEKQAAGAYDVYNFGMSDSVPSEHLNVARYVRERFAPKVMIFFCSPWHLAASLVPAAGRQRWLLDGDVVRPRKVVPLKNAALKAVAKRSALVRYLVLNARWRPKLRPGNGGGVVNAAQSSGGPKYTPAQLKTLAEYMVQRAVSENPGIQVIFVTGGPHMKDSPPTLSTVSQLIADACKRHGATHISLLPIFHADWLQHHKRFDFEHDFHWNAYAFKLVGQHLHAVVAEMLK